MSRGTNFHFVSWHHHCCCQSCCCCNWFVAVANFAAVAFVNIDVVDVIGRVVVAFLNVRKPLKL